MAGARLIDDWHSHQEAAQCEQVGSDTERDVDQGIVGVRQSRLAIMRQLHVSSTHK